MLLGSDRRAQGPGRGRRRSDTIILVRLDPSKGATALLSLPRDLKVEYPGHGTDKHQRRVLARRLALTLKTVKQALTGSRHDQPRRQRRLRRLPRGRRRDRLRVRRHRPQLLQRQQRAASATPRSTSSRATRSCAAGRARLRPLPPRGHRPRPRRAPAGLPPPGQGAGRLGKLIDYRRRRKLTKIFGRYTDSDNRLPRCLACALSSSWVIASPRATNPIREVHFEGEIGPPLGLHGLVGAREEARNGGRVPGTEAPRRRAGAPGRGRAPDSEPAPRAAGGGPGSRRRLLDAAARAGSRTSANSRLSWAGGGAPFPVFLPAREGARGRLRLGEPVCTGFAHASAHRRPPRRKGPRVAQRLPARDPPAGGSNRRVLRDRGHDLARPAHPRGSVSRSAVLGGRLNSKLHYDGDRLRLVAWRTREGVYWLSNTLTQSNNTRQMIAIAASLRRLGQK